MKNTVLHNKHVDLGAKMVEFAGYDMPVYYTGIKQEHETVRRAVGLFDVSHMGEFVVKGPKATEFLQFATSNDISKLSPGKAQYSCLPNNNGGIVDDLIVYKFDEEKYLLVVNASNIEKDWNWLSELNKDFGAEMENKSDEYSLLAVQGPKATELLQELSTENLEEIPFYSFSVGAIAGAENVIISNTGYTGSGGFELYVKNEDAPGVWDTLVEKGKKNGLLPCGLGARDTLRMEMGYCLYGNDIDDSTSPLEAGLGWITKLDTDFVNSDYFKKQKEEGVSKRLVPLIFEGKGIPRQGCEVYNENEERVGTVTSGTQSPSLKKSIALAYVDKPYNKKETELKVKVRNKMLDARVYSLPFYKDK